jgi:hypothetical protein
LEMSPSKVDEDTPVIPPPLNHTSETLLSVVHSLGIVPEMQPHHGDKLPDTQPANSAQEAFVAWYRRQQVPTLKRHIPVISQGRVVPKSKLASRLTVLLHVPKSQRSTTHR